MKKFLQVIQAHCTLLMTKIQKNEVPIASANGVTFPGKENGLTFEQATKVYTHSNAYRAESKKFWDDATKVVVPRIAFCNFLKKSNTNLLLLRPFSSSRETEIDFTAIPEKATYQTTGRFGRTVSILFFCGAFGYFFFVPFFWKKYLAFFEQTSVFAVVSIVILIFGAMVTYFLLEDKKIINARESIAFMHNQDLFNSPVSSQYSTNAKILFTQNVDYSELLAKSIQFNGALGFLVFQDFFTEKKVIPSIEKEGRMLVSMAYTGLYIPVIFLDHTLIFDVSSLEDIDQKLLRNPDPDLLNLGSFELFI